MSNLNDAKRSLVESIGTPKVEALVEALFLAAHADESFSSEEAIQFSATLEALTDRSFSGEQLERLVEQLSGKLAEDGRDARLASVAERLPDARSREQALVLAAAITASDGDFDPGENDLLADLAEALGIDPDRTVEIVAAAHDNP